MPCLTTPRALLAACLLLLSGAALAQDDADALAAGLVELRGEVEQLNTELGLLRDEQRTTLAASSALKAELQATLERQQMASRELRQTLEERRASAAAAGVAGEALVPLLDQAVADLVRHVEAGLPFKREERLAELEGFRTQLANGSLPPTRAVNRLWAFYEDEFRLTRDNSLHTQTVELDGERVLADVAKLGTVALYFQTRDGRVGQAARAGGGWRFVPLADAAAVERVEALFDALRKQVRQGFFELPMAAAPAGAER